MSSLRSLGILAEIALVCVISQAQTPPAQKAATKEPTAAPAPLIKTKTLTQEQQRALYLLEQLFETAKGFGSDRMKIRARGQIADVLWDYDEPRARDMFKEAFNSIFIMRQSHGAVGREAQAQPRFTPDSQLRIEVLQLIARRDISLAEKLSKTVIDVPSEGDAQPSPFMGRSSEQAQLYLELAMSVVATNPARAAQLAQRSLDSGIQPEFPMTLMMIGAKDRAIGDDLFLSALTAALKEPGRVSFNIASLGPYVFPDWGLGLFGGADLSYLNPGATRQVNPSLVSQFLNFVYNQLMISPEGSSASDPEGRLGKAMAGIDYMLAMQITPYFDRYMPERALEIRSRMSEMLSAIPAGPDRDQMAEFFSQATVSELIDKAENAKTENEKGMAYLRAVFASLKDGDYDNSLALVEKMGNGEMKNEFSMIVRMFAAMAALAKGDTETALRHARAIGNPQQQVNMFIAVLNKFLEKKDTIAAGTLLIEAEKLLLKLENTGEKASALVVLAASAARFDSIRGFEIMTSAVEAINHSKIADFQMDQFSKSANSGLEGYVADTLGLTSASFSQTFPQLASLDFEHALMLAKSIESKEGSVMAQLAVCRGALNNKNALMASEKENANPAASQPSKAQPSKAKTKAGDPKSTKPAASESAEPAGDKTKPTKKAASDKQPTPPTALR
ncbi:MAG: hypothetical protein DMF61_00570 [Blastocatellia bacterium AA13]|nr:MAG: hypothetical protein DMF61_00570 [Blastocatellia bacterium AA13]